MANRTINATLKIPIEISVRETPKNFIVELDKETSKFLNKKFPNHEFDIKVK